ncbi:MAG: alpha/beta hydrolase [Rhodobiaceae bacterium]|nr:alpha/beta hydrolase [Rhodobiaceae bacterium]
MRTFDSDGVEIAYLDEGEGPPILLIHGFASNARVNWVDTQWVQVLTRAGHRVVAIDNRGHGRSEKLYDPAAYPAPVMAEDAARLIRHLGIGGTAVMGYSMGARISAFLALKHPDLVSRVVFGGLGINMVHGVGAPEPIADALLAASVNDVKDRTGRTFRLFAESTKSDLKALAACIRAARQTITAEEIARIAVPVLVAVGTRDIVGGDAGELAALIPGARSFDIEGRDHMLAVGDKTFKARVLEFLEDTQ